MWILEFKSGGGGGVLHSQPLSWGKSLVKCNGLPACADSAEQEAREAILHLTRMRQGEGGGGGGGGEGESMGV